MFIFKSDNDYIKWARNEWVGLDLNKEDVGVRDETMKMVYAMSSMADDDLGLIMTVEQMRCIDTDAMEFKIDTIEEAEAYLKLKGLEDVLSKEAIGLMERSIWRGTLKQDLIQTTYDFKFKRMSREDMEKMVESKRKGIIEYLGY